MNLTAAIEYCKRRYGSVTAGLRGIAYDQYFTIEQRREVGVEVIGFDPIPADEFDAWWTGRAA